MKARITEDYTQNYGARVSLRQAELQYYPPLKGGLYRNPGSIGKNRNSGG